MTGSRASVAVICLLSLGGAIAQGYGGQTYVYQAQLSPQSTGDIQGVSGTSKVRTQGDTLFYEVSLQNGNQITFVDLHLTPRPGVVDGGPLVLRIVNVEASPLSGAVFQQGTRNTANLLASPQLTQARAGITQLGINDNGLNNIGDVDRLLARGVIYSDVHSVERVSPNGVVRGIYTTIASGQGRRLLK